MRWEAIKRVRELLVPADPYLDWRLGAGAMVGRRYPLWPVVIHLKKGTTAKRLEAKAWGANSGPALRVPCLYTNPIDGLQDASWCTGHATAPFFDLLEDPKKKLADLISRVSVFSEIDPPDQCVDLLPEEQPSTSKRSHRWSEGSVVVGIIDFGIAFAHERFRLDRQSTRIEHLWVQDGCPAPGDPAPGEVPYGREVTAETIDAWLSAGDGCTDEDALYGRAARVLGRRWLRSIARQMAHGTHVADTAAGYSLGDLDQPERNKRPIVCVQLPEATVADTSAASLDPYVLDGIRFILQRAHEIAVRSGLGPLPVVINFSSGEVAGPHDGSSDPEQAMDELIRMRSKFAAPLGIVISAGNSHLGGFTPARSTIRQRAPRASRQAHQCGCTGTPCPTIGRRASWRSGCLTTCQVRPKERARSGCRSLHPEAPRPRLGLMRRNPAQGSSTRRATPSSARPATSMLIIRRAAACSYRAPTDAS